jgi:23S rRNA (guanosine2251-2'-O)-methyltransferase
VTGPARRGRASRREGHIGNRTLDPWVGGRRAVAEAASAGLAAEVLVATSSRTTPGLRDALAAAGAAGVPVRTAARSELDRLAPDHQGIVARLRPVGVLSERDLSTWPFGDGDILVALDGITDPQNLGAAARAADAGGAVMLVSRVRRAAGISPAAIRASVGALLHLPHVRVANLPRALERLKDQRFIVIGLDEKAERTVYESPCPPGRVALVIGSEGEGLSRLTREACDELVTLPMSGRVSSLNASAALAAALFAYVLPGRQPGR